MSFDKDIKIFENANQDKITYPEIKPESSNRDKIIYPEIKTVGHAERAYNDLILDYMLAYNKGKKLGERLRDAHIIMYHELIKLLRKQIYKDNISLARGEKNPKAAIDPTKPYAFNVNNGYLQAIIKGVGSKKTVYNRLKRLIEAGVLTKQGHGAYRDFTLLINPKLVLIWDKNNPFYNPTEHISLKNQKAENQPIENTTKVNITDVSVLTDNILNKIINDVGNAEYGIRLPAHDLLNNTDTIHRYTPKQAKSNEKHPERIIKSGEKTEKKEKSSAKKEKSWNGSRWDKDWWIELWVKQFYALLVNTLFAEHDIWEFEKERTLELLRKVFAQTTSVKQGGRFMAAYRWRIMAAARWTSAKKYNISNVYPYAYLTNQGKGKFAFGNTKKWYAKHLNYIVDRDKRNAKFDKIIQEQKKLQNACSAYLQDPTLIAFRKYEQYVQQNIPHLLSDFYAGIGIADIQKNKINTDKLNINQKSRKCMNQ